MTDIQEFFDEQQLNDEEEGMDARNESCYGIEEDLPLTITQYKQVYGDDRSRQRLSLLCKTRGEIDGHKCSQSGKCYLIS